MTEPAIRRLVLVGSVIVDIVLYVEGPCPNEAGTSWPAHSMTTAGGGFNVFAAASAAKGCTRRTGDLGVGTGPFGAQVLRRPRGPMFGGRLARPSPPPGWTPGSASRWSRRPGERTFATTVGAEGRTDR